MKKLRLKETEELESGSVQIPGHVCPSPKLMQLTIGHFILEAQSPTGCLAVLGDGGLGRSLCKDAFH